MRIGAAERPSNPFLALLSLRATLLKRDLTTSRARLVLTLVVALALALPALGSAVLLGLALSPADPGTREAVVHLVLAVAWGAWALSPLLGFREAEFFDPQKLALLPVRHETVFAAGLFGAILSRSVLFLGPSFAAAATATARGPAEVAAAALLALLLLLQALAAGRCLTLALLHTLRSRRFRDAIAILSPLVAVGIYASWRGLSSADARWLEAAIAAGRSPALLALPSGWISHALPGIEAPFLTKAGFLALFASSLVLLVKLGTALEKRAFHAEVDIGPRAREVGAKRRTPLLARLLDAALPAEAAAVAVKDLTIFKREPAMKAQILSLAGFLLVPAFFGVSRVGAPGTGGASAGFAADPLPFLSMILALMASGFLTNLFALEGTGLPHLLLCPAPRPRVLLGKAAAALLVFAPINVFLLGAGAALTAALRGAELAPLVPDFVRHALFHALFLAVLASAGFFSSIVAPIRTLPRGKRVSSQKPAERAGCLHAVLRLGILLGAAVASAPIAALVFLPKVLGLGPAVAAAFALLAVATAGALLLLAARLAGDLLSAREADLAARFTKASE